MDIYWSQMMNEMATKKEVMAEIYRYFQHDEQMVLLAGDMGFAVLDDFLNNHPQRAFNVGICEQATMSMAMGLYLVGLKPIIYSQVPFLVMRAYEQIRYDLNEHTANVKLIGVGADNYFSKLGRSHCMDQDDIKMMTIFENFLLLEPTKESLSTDIEQMLAYDGPAYLRCI